MDFTKGDILFEEKEIVQNGPFSLEFKMEGPFTVQAIDKEWMIIKDNIGHIRLITENEFEKFIKIGNLIIEYIDTRTQKIITGLCIIEELKMGVCPSVFRRSFREKQGEIVSFDDELS